MEAPLPRLEGLIGSIDTHIHIETGLGVSGAMLFDVHAHLIAPELRPGLEEHLAAAYRWVTYAGGSGCAGLW